MTSTNLISTVDEDELDDSTVTRIRGEMVVWANGRAQVDQQVIGFAGIIAGHENLLTTLPDPELDDADWMWYWTGFLVHNSESNDADSASLFPFRPRYIPIDNRSQRKLRSKESALIFIFKNDVSSNITVNVGIATRTLLLRHP